MIWPGFIIPAAGWNCSTLYQEISAYVSEHSQFTELQSDAGEIITENLGIN